MESKTKFFTFDQNNTGGRFLDNMPLFLIVEAIDSFQADDIAINNGVYFNGCEIGLDCECCGDRWTESSNNDSSETPNIYGNPVEQFKSQWGNYVAKVIYLNGTVKEYKTDKSNEL